VALLDFMRRASETPSASRELPSSAGACLSVLHPSVSSHYIFVRADTLLLAMGGALPTSILGLAEYRAALARLAQERETANAEAKRATQGIAELLPPAIQAGVSIVDAAQITGLSRPTVYRLLSAARARRPLRDLATHFEQALEQNSQALPAELASHFGTSIEQVFSALSALFPLVSDDFQALGPSAITDLVKLLPDLDAPQSVVLAMLFLQGQTTDHVAASTRLPATEVLGWAALGLLRVMPRIRAARSAGQRAGWEG
jgi:hypothetical protein